MVANKRVIGVCLTQIEDRTHADYVNYLRAVAAKYNYKVIVFNSVVDFYYNDLYDEGAKSVYNIINYDLVDILVVFSDYFFNKDIPDSIVAQAKEHNVPVVLMNYTAEGCYSIIKDYKDNYKSVINHVIRDHGVKEPFFIAGRQYDDKDTEIRLQCFKEVLAENGLEFDESCVAYGEYWATPTNVIIDKLVENDKKLPDAFICANDYMAIAVCERLEKYGYRVPEDIIVTGFDGILEAEYFYPQLTTCKEKLDELAEMTVDVANKILDEKIPCQVFEQKYEPVISESCGCEVHTQFNRNNTRPLLRMIHDMETRENSVYEWIERVLAHENLRHIGSMFAQRIMPGSYVCIKKQLVRAVLDNEAVDADDISGESYIAIPSMYNTDYDNGKLQKFNIEKMLPNLEEWAEDDSVYVLTAIFIGRTVGGYYAVSVDDILANAGQITRLAKTVSIVAKVIWNDYKQRCLRQSVENATLTDSVTGIPNLKGALKWFEKFAADKENHKKTIMVSVYGMPKYKYIYENYGIQEIEEVVCKVAELLQLANKEDCFIAHVTEENFIIINYLQPGMESSAVIDKATTAFYGAIERYNSSNNKEYYVEVNAGCTVVYPGWDGTLESFIKLANNEMYINRLKQGMGVAVKEENKFEYNYSAFNLLLENNLFTYHFQPIIDAKTGEIYAYEALMRTDAIIGMNPLQVLETAEAYKRLYEIERATMFNVMERFSNDFEQFRNRKVFINSIPGYILNPTDTKLLGEKYSAYMEYFVFEITEQNAISEEELNALKNIGNTGKSNEIAIDDYGTGHSNIVNLIRYAPQIIKIDRFLITDIHQDVNKQMFVKSTIDFARMNNIKVLAEGVETVEELRTVIGFGVDYVQGYYTGRPAPEPIAAIDEKVKREILEANPVFKPV